MRVISGTARGTTLQTIDDIKTRPTLDRVKESLFNVLQDKIRDSVVLDLFAGSGAIGIEFLSRGASKTYFVDNSTKTFNIIQKNLEKTKLKDKAIVEKNDYKKWLEQFHQEEFDIVFLDPPYKNDYAVDAIIKINNKKLLKEEGIIIIETDDPVREINELGKLDIDYKMYDLRKYGRASLIFLK